MNPKFYCTNCGEVFIDAEQIDWTFESGDYPECTNDPTASEEGQCRGCGAHDAIGDYAQHLDIEIDEIRRDYAAKTTAWEYIPWPEPNETNETDRTAMDYADEPPNDGQDGDYLD